MCKKIVLSIIVVGIVMTILGFISQATWVPALHPTLMQEYTSGAYRAWSDPLMSYVFVHPFVIALIMSLVYVLFNPFQKIKSIYAKGAYYGFVIWLIGTLPGMLMTLSSFSPDVVSEKTILVWTLDGLVKAVLGGIALVYIMDKK